MTPASIVKVSSSSTKTSPVIIYGEFAAVNTPESEPDTPPYTVVFVMVDPVAPQSAVASAYEIVMIAPPETSNEPSSLLLVDCGLLYRSTAS